MMEEQDGTGNHAVEMGDKVNDNLNILVGNEISNNNLTILAMLVLLYGAAAMMEKEADATLTWTTALTRTLLKYLTEVNSSPAYGNGVGRFKAAGFRQVAT